MKTKVVEFEIRHTVNTVPQEIIDNYVDYGHEVFWHSKGYNQWWRRFDFVRVNIQSPTKHLVHITLIMFGFWRREFDQEVTLIPGKGMISIGKNPFGLPLRSEWILEQKGEWYTEARVIYKTEVPLFFYFLMPFLISYWRKVREGVWYEDAVMMERRSKLLRLGFNNGGIYPQRQPAS